jgi:catechol 2,3-dioxygenase-like lactoylglutathione lyase family enzyme
MQTGARFGTRDIKRAIEFYDAIAEIIGAKRVIDRHGMAGYRGAEGGLFIVGTPRDGEATVGNGSQVMFAAPSPEAVSAAHAKALELGGRCEGPPGPRGAPENNLYAAYFRDPDGNKIMVLHSGAG